MYGLATPPPVGYSGPFMGPLFTPTPLAPLAPFPEMEELDYQFKAPVLSASQVDTYRECVRKWAWKYLEKIPDLPNSSARLGTKCHSVLEAWLLHGTYPDTQEIFQTQARDGHWVDHFPGQIVQAGLHLLPAPGIANVEGSFRLESRASAWRGFRDAVFLEDLASITSQAFAPDPIVAQLPGIIPVVLDHKTTANFRWMKSEDVLASDAQANIYAAKTMEDMATREVLARWVYYRTTGRPEAKLVEVLFTVDHVAAQMEVLDAQAAEIHQLYQLRPKALELPASPEACGNYGGCPHVQRCNLGTYERMVAQMAHESIQDMMDRKKREREAAEASGVPPAAPVAPPPPVHGPGAGPPVPVPQAPPAPVAPPVQAPPAPAPVAAAPPVYWRPGDPMNPAQEYLQGRGASLSTIASAADVPPPDHIAKAYDAGGLTEAGTINPPEAPAAAPPTPAHMPPVAPAAPKVETIQDDLAPLTRDQLKVLALQLQLVDSSSRLGADSLRTMIREARAKGHVVPVQAPAAPVAPPPPAQAPAAPVQAPPIPAAPSVQAAVQAYVDPAAPVAPPPPVQATDTAGNPHGFLLLVNAAPVKGLVEDAFQLDTILAEYVLPRMRADTGLPDYRLEDYGKGPGRLAAYLEGFLQEAELGRDSAIMVDGRSDEGRACLSTLSRYAGIVIRGY